MIRRYSTWMADDAFGSNPPVRSPHLSYSCASPFGPAALVTHDPKWTLDAIFYCLGLKCWRPRRWRRFASFHDVDVRHFRGLVPGPLNFVHIARGFRNLKHNLVVPADCEPTSGS
jgi:hypothetical protein